MARKLQPVKERNFRIKDLDCIIDVLVSTRIDVLDYMDQLIENLEIYDSLLEKGKGNAWQYNCSDESVSILYKDGTWDFINEEYDGHKIRRQNIQGIMYEDGYATRVFGAFQINDCGVCTLSDTGYEIIDDTNIEEVF